MAVGAYRAQAAPEAAVPVAPPRRRPGRGLVLLLLAAALFLGHGSRTLDAPFGDSHDGRNAGVWALGSRSLRLHGPIASKLGTRSPENSVYANHPPLIYVETAAAELVGFGSRAATRAPAWVGSLLMLLLLRRLLLERGLGPRAVGIGLLLAATTPMFLVYGTMLDTPVTSLPFGVGLLLLWERARRGEHVRPLVAAGLAALAVLAGWQSLLLSGAIAGWAAVRLVRRGRRSLDLAFLGGALAGAISLLAWLLWAFGGTFRPLLDQFLLRTGQTVPVSVGALLHAERRDIVEMFGVMALLGVAGLLLAFRRPQIRGVAALAVAVTVPYPIIFKSGAVNHNYWNYWCLLPLAVGLAVGADTLLRAWASRGRQEPVLVVAAVGLATLLTLGAWVAPSGAEWQKLHAYRSADVVARAELDPRQVQIWFAGAVGEPASWLSLATRRPSAPVPTSAYAALAASRPTDLVLVGEMRCVAGVEQRTFSIRPAASLADRPPVVEPCE